MEKPSRSLLERLAEIPDPRSPHGRRHPLTAILALAVVGILAGMKSLEAIAQFGRDQGKPLAEALGFRRHRTPCKATLSNIFRRLDVTRFERVLTDWVTDHNLASADQIAIDGKVLRGSADGDTPGVLLLSAYAPKTSAVLAQIEVKRTTNEHKAALELLGILPLKEKVITGDAIFTQRDLSQKIVDEGGDYIFVAKENQTTLQREIEQAFGPDEAFSPLRSTRAQEPTPAVHGV
jgi:hypothetical protein